MNRKLLVLLALCAVAAIVAYRASGWDFDWTLFLGSLKNLNPVWLLASVAVTLLAYWLRAMRWGVLLAPLKSVGMGSLFSTTLVGFSAIYILGRAGEIARPLWLSRRESIPLSAGVATIVVERFLDMLMLIVLFAGTLLVVEAPTASDTTMGLLRKAAWGVAGTAVAAIAVLFFIRSNAKWIVRFIRFRRVAKLFEDFAGGLSSLQGGRALAAVLFQSIVIWASIALQFWFMLLGMNIRFSLGAATLVMVSAAIGSIAQIPGIGGGFQAGYVFAMTALFRVPVEQALATSLIITVLSFGPTIAIAAVYMMARGISLRELKASLSKSETETL